MVTAPATAAKNPAPVAGHLDGGPAVFSAQGLNVWYGEKQALKDVALGIQERQVTAFIGPSG